MSRAQEMVALVGHDVLVPWPNEPTVQFWMKVLDVDRRFGKWQLQVQPYEGASFWIRRWVAHEVGGG